MDLPVWLVAASLPVWLVTIIVLAVNFVLPFALGTVISRALNMKEAAFRIGIVLFSVMLALTPFTLQMANGKSPLNSLRFGIDLAGGTNLVYQVDRELAEKTEKEVNDRSMDRLVGAIAKRINPSGTEEVTVRKVGTDRVEVIIPGADPDEVARKKRQMTDLGSLEFSILANERKHSSIIKQAQSVERDVREGTNLIARWVPVGKTADGKIKTIGQHGRVAFREREVDGEKIPEFLVIVSPDKAKVTGKYLTRAFQQVGEQGTPVVGFNFNQRGAYLFGQLTTEYQPEKDGFKHRLAMVLNGEIHSAPNLNDVITSNGQIDGNFTREEIQELTSVLNAGALELPLIQAPVNEFSISPLLGKDVQEKGTMAIIIAIGCVLLFMAGYYLIAGVVADICLFINMILVLGTMALIDATFTLPGLAGLVLTVGMSVDANVLIFERIREEQTKGSSLRMAIQNGFDKAFTTIVDANVTTLITAVILYVIGTDQVKGFAVTLFIGIVMGMFSALFIGRLLFDILERKRMIKEVKMMSIVGKTDINFTSKQGMAAVCSIALIIGGMLAFSARGEDNLDIDFTGGSMVTFKFDSDTPSVDEARTILEKTAGKNITIEELIVPKTDSQKEKFFRLRTKNGNLDEVKGQVYDAFAESKFDLHKVTLQLAENPVEPISTEASDDPKSDDKKDDTKTAAVDEDFAGGNQATLKFSDEISTTTVVENFVIALKSLKDQEVDDPAALIGVAGTAGSGVDAAEGETRRYSEFVLKAKPELASADVASALTAMQSTMAKQPILDQVNTFDSSVASETRNDAILAMLASLIAIVAYIWFRFERVTFGIAAVVALVHDVLCVLGLVAIASFLSGNALGQALGFYDFKINLPMIAAFLTIVGYSLNDTIVVFDRIREVRGKNPDMTGSMINMSLNQTLARTLLTSITTLIVVLILYISGGEGIHGFAFCLVMGVFIGTYSSIFIASPVLLWLMNRPAPAPSNTTAPAKA